MMIKLMTWFIELQNRFNELRLFKTLMIYVLNQIDDLTSWQEISIQRSSNNVRMLRDQKSHHAEFSFTR